MNTFQRDELLSLAEDILTNPEGVQWTFGAFYLPVSQIPNGPPCLTLQCALGRMPARRPDKWKLKSVPKSNGGMVVQLEGYDSTRLSAMDYFGLGSDEVETLFNTPIARYGACIAL